jgi:hypothetical protein
MATRLPWLTRVAMRRNLTSDVLRRLFFSLCFRSQLAKAFTELTGDERELEWEADIVDKVRQEICSGFTPLTYLNKLHAKPARQKF